MNVQLIINIRTLLHMTHDCNMIIRGKYGGWMCLRGERERGEEREAFSVCVLGGGDTFSKLQW